MNEHRERYEHLMWLEGQLAAAIACADDEPSGFPFRVGTKAARRRLDSARSKTWDSIEALLLQMADEDGRLRNDGDAKGLLKYDGLIVQDAGGHRETAG